MLVAVLILALAPHILARPESPDYDRVMHPPPLPADGRVSANPDEATSEYWINMAQNKILEKISTPPNTNVAKNVIIFLGDGMSIPTVAAARVYMQGEEAQLSFDNFPHTALSKTYAIDKQVADSAGTATAYLCGVKANYATIGVNGQVPYDDCDQMINTTNHAMSIAYFSQLAGKRTGIVTTAEITNASPAGVYAHTASRSWETDTNVIDAGLDPTVCVDIARQLVEGETGRNFDVVMGGGRQKMLPKGFVDEEGSEGQRSDGANLIDEWMSMREGLNPKYAWNRNELLNLDVKNFQLLGLFAASHIDYNLDRDPEMDPSLAEMTRAAITVLSRGVNASNGYFLFVEGARIDMGHHENRPRRALNETVEFSKAVQVAVEMTDESDTLIVVTADHAHTMSYSGYGSRGNNILEFGGTADDGMVWTTLNYANGPGYREPQDGHRFDFSSEDLTDPKLTYPNTAPIGSESHGGDDVAIYARGPWSHLFSGVLEQNIIPHIMMYASCVGDGAKACDAK